MAATIKICLDAGHGINTPGKRCNKNIDPNETREWFLNQRIVSKLQEKLKGYNVEVIRVDDPTGSQDVPLKTRTDIANREKCDLYLSFHHDAGANCTDAGGISVFTYDNRESLSKLRYMIYKSLVGHGGLTGRSTPLRTADFHVLRETTMDAVLVEHGFMDSTKDTPVILNESYADSMAEGWFSFLVEYFNLEQVSGKSQASTGQVSVNVLTMYYVQCGAFMDKENAEKLVKDLKASGYEAIIKEQAYE